MPARDKHLWGNLRPGSGRRVRHSKRDRATIAGQLRAKLSPKEKAAIEQPPTADLKAYALYSEANAIGGAGMISRKKICFEK